MNEDPRSIAMKLARRVRITVRATLSERLATAFEDMTVTSRCGRTDIVGEVVDQAQLFGLLARIRDLGIELESLNPALDEPRPASDAECDEYEEA